MEISLIKNIIKKYIPDKVISFFNKIILILTTVRFKPKKKHCILKYDPTYNEDGLFTNHNCDFLKDPLFQESYNLGFQTGSSYGWHLRWRVYTLCWAANHSKHLSGDFIECGTNKGMTARAIINYTNFKNLNKTFWLMDTYSGLSSDLQTISENNRTNSPDYKECYNEVRKTFSEFANVKLIRGTIPDTLSLVKSEEISFMHIDMNCVAPEIAAGEYFWDKLVSGAIVILDDYAYPGYIEQKHAWDKFSKVKGFEILTLPTGQGLIFI